ncbi:MAG: hypothetical protein WB760_35110 [Xanthobacteraceae bacterium]
MKGLALNLFEHEWTIIIIISAASAVFALLGLNFFLKKDAPRLAKLLSIVVALLVWISAQLYKEFTGVGLDDIARHYVALGACRVFAVCKPEPAARDVLCPDMRVTHNIFGPEVADLSSAVRAEVGPSWRLESGWNLVWRDLQ